QQAGYQHQAKTDNMGLYWTATQPQTGKQVNVFPKMQPGHDYAGLIFAKAVPMPVGGVTPEKLKEVNAKLGQGCAIIHDAKTNTLLAATVHNFNNSNAQEVKALLDNIIAKADLASQLLNGNGQPAPLPAPAPQPAPTPVPAPVPAPVVVPNLAGTTWSGSEN